MGLHVMAADAEQADTAIKLGGMIAERTICAFTVPGEARGKGRPRFGRGKGGRPVTFTDSKTAAYESLVRLAAHQAYSAPAPTTAPVAVDITVRLAPAASASRAKRAAMLGGSIQPTKRPDVDNCAKAVLDGCNGVIFADDAQIVRLTASKVYAEAAGVDVTVRGIG